MIIILPAAGWGTRIPNKIGSKELIKVKGIPVVSYALSAASMCDCPIIIVTRKDKEDTTKFIQSTPHNYRCVFVEQFYFSDEGTSPGLAQAIDSAYPEIFGQDVLLGFPDTIFTPLSAYKSLMDQFQEMRCTILLGLVEHPYSSHSAVIMDNFNKVLRIHDKEDGIFTWFTAIWCAEFTEFLHASVSGGKFDFVSICNEYLCKGNVVRGFSVAQTFYDIMDLKESSE